MSDLNSKDLLSVHGTGETTPKEDAPKMSASRERLRALEVDFQNGKLEPALSTLRNVAEEAGGDPSDCGFAALLLVQYYGGLYPNFTNSPDWRRLDYYSEIATDAGYFQAYAHTAMAKISQGQTDGVLEDLRRGMQHNDLLSLQYMLQEDIQKELISATNFNGDRGLLWLWGDIYSAMNRYIRHPENHDTFVTQDLRSRKAVLLQRVLDIHRGIVNNSAKVIDHSYDFKKELPGEIERAMESQPDEADLAVLRQMKDFYKPVSVMAGEKSIFNRPDRKDQTRIARRATIVALVLLWVITYMLPRHVPVHLPFMLRRVIPILLVIGICRQRHRLAGTHFFNNPMKFTAICTLGLLVYEFLNREGAMFNWLYYRLAFLPFSHGWLNYLLFLLPYLLVVFIAVKKEMRQDT